VVCLDRDPDAWLLRICGEGVIWSSVSMNLDIGKVCYMCSLWSISVLWVTAVDTI